MFTANLNAIVNHHQTQPLLGYCCLCRQVPLDRRDKSPFFSIDGAAVVFT